jgi:hypothetical protein
MWRMRQFKKDEDKHEHSYKDEGARNDDQGPLSDLAVA